MCTLQATYDKLNFIAQADSRCMCTLQATYDKLNSEVPKYKMITASVLSDRLRVRFAVGTNAVWSKAEATVSGIYLAWGCPDPIPHS